MLTQVAYEVLKKKPYRTVSVSYKRKRFRVELADSFMKKMVGLMYRQTIGKSAGMLFPIADPGVLAATITMMNMKFSIDIIWLDEKKRVVDIAEKAQPTSSMFDSYRPRRAAKYVIELEAGAARRLGIRIGDKMKFG